MRRYTESEEETLRARALLKQWTSDGALTKEQCRRLEQDTASDLRTTNVFLRLVLFFFTIIGVAAAAGLCFTIVLSRPSQQTIGCFLLIFAAISYTAAEVAVSEARLYRYGIEEALAVCSVAFLCAGLELCFFSSLSLTSRAMESIVPAFGALASLWIWYRYNLWYAFPAAMILAAFVPIYWTPSHTSQRVLIAAFYTFGLICTLRIRPRHRFDYLEHSHSISEASLWLGLYLILNLKIASLSFPLYGLLYPLHTTDFAPAFFWTTWVFSWCLPPLILMRGIHLKDRFIMAAGAVTAILTLITNKLYLGWPRHTWDPILLGVALTAFALFLRRWLALGPAGVRHGFTAVRLSGRDKHAMSLGSTVLGLATPESITPAPQSPKPDFHFGGGTSGGAGSTGDF